MFSCVERSYEVILYLFSDRETKKRTCRLSLDGDPIAVRIAGRVSLRCRVDSKHVTGVHSGAASMG